MLHHLVTFLSVTLVTWLPAADASAFLGQQDQAQNLNTNTSVLEDLGRIIGKQRVDETSERVDKLVGTLASTFKALPSVGGRLDLAATRFLLHRYFVDRHGWYVRGLEPAGEAWNSSSPTAMLAPHGAEMQNIFDARLNARGLTLHEVAVLAATLESSVHNETLARLHAAYEVTGLSKVEDHAKESDVLSVIDTYMTMYILGINHAKLDGKRLNQSMQLVHKLYPHWGETQKWVREVRVEILQQSPESRNSFNTTARILEVVADRYGHWQDQECLSIKNYMVKLEQSGTGRVSLADFYGAALKGKWEFSESRAYLRQLGALDESNPNQPAVVIPNYVNAPSNCIASSKFYSVCCINECEALLGFLERKIAAPDSDPDSILELVGQLPSATVDTPRALPALLAQRLGEIATQHGGRVPLHGRLFAQWLHHAYPRECPFPHLSGTSKPQTQTQWWRSTKQNPIADKATMQWHLEELNKAAQFTHRVANTSRNPLYESVDEVPWLPDEELYVQLPGEESVDDTTKLFAAVRQGVVLVALACSMALAMMQKLSRARETLSCRPQQKHSV